MEHRRYPTGSIFAERYRIVKQIGAGAMGEVMQVEDILLNNATMALKIVDRRLHDKRLTRLQNEASLASCLRHPNVVSVFDSGRNTSGHAWIAMELVPGKSLNNFIKHEPLSLERALGVILQIASGVRAAHNAGIVHRDLKPHNVLVSPTGEMKVADFGVAKSLDFDLRLTLSGELAGTLCYAAPEQSSRGTADPRMDVYALGIMLYELLSGEVPFYSIAPLLLQRMHREKPMPYIRKTVPGVPLWVEGVIGRCTKKDPSHRYKSMQEVIEVLLINAAPAVTKTLPLHMQGKNWLFLS
ncbi:MAG: serine/threonine protein kinase [Deltaproteobacteria bacterium]|nr:serine/threonine protein kinase [Deltaproteobacteria bacterium]